MMNVFDWSLVASLAYAGGPRRGPKPSRLPSHAVTARRSTSPSRVLFAVGKLRSPLSHASVAAKHAVGVEVAARPVDGLAAPFTWLRLSAAAGDIWLAGLRRHPAREGAKTLTSLSRAACGLTTGLACRNRGSAPSRQQITSAGTEPLFGPSVLRRILGVALLAIPALCCMFHKAIISHEERYCEIAVRRLAQEVLPLEPYEPPLQQVSLLDEVAS
jgi:hypothetical protein